MRPQQGSGGERLLLDLQQHDQVVWPDSLDVFDVEHVPRRPWDGLSLRRTHLSDVRCSFCSAGEPVQDIGRRLCRQPRGHIHDEDHGAEADDAFEADDSVVPHHPDRADAQHHPGGSRVHRPDPNDGGGRRLAVLVDQPKDLALQPERVVRGLYRAGVLGEQPRLHRHRTVRFHGNGISGEAADGISEDGTNATFKIVQPPVVTGWAYLTHLQVEFDCFPRMLALPTRGERHTAVLLGLQQAVTQRGTACSFVRRTPAFPQNAHGLLLTMPGSLPSERFRRVVSRNRDDLSAAGANGATLYARDNGAGTTQLVVRFSNGALGVENEACSEGAQDVEDVRPLHTDPVTRVGNHDPLG